MLGILGIQGHPWIRALIGAALVAIGLSVDGRLLVVIGAALAVWGAGEGVWRIVGGHAGPGGRG
jgi:hypothetical protein